MLGASSNSNSTSHTTGNISLLNTMSLQKVFPCNACDLIFNNSQAQRIHMREPWHVYNIKRRMSSLPPISQDNYEENVATKLVSCKQDIVKVASSEPALQPPSPQEDLTDDGDQGERAKFNGGQLRCCLFCSKEADSFETNLEHMSAEHGLYIPDIEHLSSLEVTINYLRTVIIEYKECLFCGMTKQSVHGIRQHMLDKGHCMINLEREPELLEFWQYSDSDSDILNVDDEETTRLQDTRDGILASPDLTQDDYVLPSGRTIGTKSKAREARQIARHMASTSKDAGNRTVVESAINNTDLARINDPVELLQEAQAEVQDRTLSTRNAAGLIGVSDQQKRALIMLERKTQKQQAIVRASAAWAGDKGGTHQRFYKVKMNLRAG